MKKIIEELAGKKFSVYVNGEFENTTNFLGLIQLLARFSDFFNYKSTEQVKYFKESMQDKTFYIDVDMSVRFK